MSLCGLSVSLFATDNEVSRFTFQDEIDLSPSTHLRLLFDSHARDPPAASVENLLDICVKGLKSSSSDSVRFSVGDVSLSLEEESKEDGGDGDDSEEKKEEDEGESKEE